MTRRLATLFLLGLILSGCVHENLLKLRPGIQQEIPVNDAWVKEGNRYLTRVEYISPGGQEINNFTLTLENGIVKDVQVNIETKIAASIRFQEQFAQALPQVIIGKPLSELGNIAHVSGASLTTDAFNQAVRRLQAQF